MMNGVFVFAVRMSILVVALLVPAQFVAGQSLDEASAGPGADAGESERADTAFFSRILKEHCVRCHDADVSEGDVRLDMIDWSDLSEHAANLQEALEQVILEDMPPPDDSNLSKPDRLKFHLLLTESLRRFHAANREPAEFIPARLNKAQFVNSLEELLAICIREDLVASLPGDKSGDSSTDKDLFNTNRNTLTFSLLHYELYKSCIEDALDQAIPDETPVMSPFWSNRFDLSVETFTPTKGRDRGKEVPRLIIRGQVVKDAEPPTGYTWNQTQTLDRLPTKRRFDVDDYVDTSFLSLSKTRVSPPHPLADNGFILHPQYSPLEFDRIDVHFLGPNATLIFKDLKKTDGVYRLRIHACKGDDNPQHPRLAVYSGPVSYFLSPKMRRASSPVIVDAPKGEHKVYEFYARFKEEMVTTVPRVAKVPLGFLLRNEYFKPGGVKVVTPALHIQRIDLDGPYYASWPLPRERNIFPERKIGEFEPDYARRTINRFLVRAFRGDVKPQLQERYFAQWQSLRTDASFRQSIKQTFEAILLSPYFLYIDADAAKNRNQEIATRLAYFLWNSPPSAELLQRAKSPQWNAKDELDGVLSHPKSERFAHAFAREWLQLKDKPDEMLRGRVINHAMFQEPGVFLRYVLSSDLSLENLVDSDFLIVNDALAKWYEIEKPQGVGFSHVKLPDDSPYGGVLTMSAPLTSHAGDFGVSDPILRGVWLCERILGRHLPPPPMNVEFPNPDDFEGFDKLTIKEQLEFHQKNPACYGCHRRIDPLGLPFENFDGYGRWRENNYKYEVRGKSARPVVLAKSDARSTIKGDSVNGIVEFKTLLKTKYKDEVIAAFSEFLYSYAIGRAARLEEQTLLDEMATKLKASGYRPKTLLGIIVDSDAFSNPRNPKR